ncbi:hypothetical protein UCDDA912_g08016 [Diaporthe ampelina]|uniref:Uncharacterized protein n=1 Tax=Diaporthe ampelina TaxID=1214573 RepID=A0A0G2FCX6_9PEZI|nr:hypothetical protein UCDDA912_g08016 [Diaporthe ampelina]
MSASLVHNEKTAIVTPVIAKKFGSRSTDSRIPSSPTHGEYRIASRQQAVEENIRPSLKSKTESRYIGEDHECFELDAVASFCQEFGIELDGNPWKNFKRLLCGYQDLPFIILQNPTNEHEFEYERMKKCPTLQWLSDVLEEIGLTLEDVVIVDICSLFSDNDLNRMGKDSQRTWDAVEKSYVCHLGSSAADEWALEEDMGASAE